MPGRWSPKQSSHENGGFVPRKLVDLIALEQDLVTKARTSRFVAFFDLCEIVLVAMIQMVYSVQDHIVLFSAIFFCEGPRVLRILR